MEDSSQMTKKNDPVVIDNTFKNIAQSLSPEPEKLIESQINANDQQLQSKKFEL